ncbi:MAG: prepilin peptidase [Nanoarchaeota archaeon]|nr:prepilin peptidase [Nanoarchaeota archaeon]
MSEYLFLFVIALIWLIFASVQDLKVREVANWLNFSLVSIALAYRLFYSIGVDDYTFFLSGILGVLVFFLISQAFYYGKVFGGGDAKLLVGFGALLPFSSLNEFILQGAFFLLLLFSVGAIYSLIASVIFAFKNKNKFFKSFSKLNREFDWRFYGLLFLFVFGIVSYGYKVSYGLIFVVVLLLLAFLFIYLRAVDKSCMLVYVKPRDLREGDWIGEEIKISGKLIGNSVHGLSLLEINKLIKRGKSVLIKQGVPFVPVFLFSYVIMLFFFFLEVDILALFLRLFQL